MANLSSFQFSLLPVCLSLNLFMGIATIWTSSFTAHGDYSTSCGSGDDQQCLDGKLTGDGYVSLAGAGETNWIGQPMPLQRPTIYIGSKMPSMEATIDNEYMWGYYPGGGDGLGTYLASRVAGKKEDPAEYVGLGWIFQAGLYSGLRVMLAADVELIGVGALGYVALFVQVLNERSGHTIVLDNMRKRRITQTGHFRVVVQVPEYTGCSRPDDDFMPDVIQVGFLLVGGRGFVELHNPEFSPTHLPITGGSPPWDGPPAVYRYRSFLP